MTARTVLLIESAILTPETSPTALPLIADRRADGGLVLTTLDEATRIELHADDLAALMAYATPQSPDSRGDGAPVWDVSPVPRSRDAQVVSAPILRGQQADERRAERIEAAIAHIRSIAVDGIMPSAAQYDGSRPPHLASSATLCNYAGRKWTDLAADLGLGLSTTQMRGSMRGQPALPRVDSPQLAEPASDPEPEPVAVAPPVAATATPTQPPATNGHRAVDGAAAKRDKLLDDACDALRGMSNGAGRMPSMKEYNARKPAALPRAGDLMAALGIDHWGEMAKAAKLVWLPGQR